MIPCMTIVYKKGVGRIGFEQRQEKSGAACRAVFLCKKKKERQNIQTKCRRLSDGGDWKVGTGRLESVLIGHPVDGVGDTFMFVRVASAHDGTDAGFLSGIGGSDQFLGSGLFHFDAIFALEAAAISKLLKKIKKN